MSSNIFEVGKGKWRAYVDNVIAASPANCKLVVCYYKAIESDALLITRTTKANIDAQVANTEADFDNYVATELGTVTSGVTTGEAWADAANFTISAAGSAGGGTNNTLAKAILFYNPDNTGALSASIPLAYYDCVLTTNGVDLEFKVPTSGLIRTG